MRTEIIQLSRLGPLPPESASEPEIANRQRLIERITPPITLEEAVALARLLGPDDCFGLAWSVVHLIESAPGWAIQYVPDGTSPVLSRLRSRLTNATRMHGA
jgi:hypothetical protein